MSAELQIGARIGKYELRRQIGKGGFGDVFVAHDHALGRDVALKVLQDEHAYNIEVMQRFLQEARAAARVTHPGIVAVFECGQVGSGNDQHVYIAMELLVGETLTSRLGRLRRFGPAAAAEVCRQVASALEAAHRAGIIHRDLKPDNVFLAADPTAPAGERVKVLDFGIAKLADGRQYGVHTQAMVVFGTPRYMSPEQCRSAADIDARSDIYALGCILFEMLAGRPPFVGEQGELLARHQFAPAPELRTYAPDAPPALAALVARMLAKTPGDRPQTMSELERAIAALGALPVEAAPMTAAAAPASGVAPTLLDDARAPAPAVTAPARPQPAPAEAAAPPPARIPAPGDGPQTTLGGAAGALDAAAPRSRGRKRWFGALVLAVGVAIAIVAVYAGRSGGPAPANHPEPAAAPSATPAAPPAPPPPAIAAPATTSISQPSTHPDGGVDARVQKTP